MVSLVGLDYEKFHGKTLIASRGAGQINFEDGGVAFKSVLFQFDDCCLCIEVDEDSDEICLSERLSILENDLQSVQLFEEYIGLEMGWMWVACNSQGYKDIFILSFSGPDPQILLCGTAAMIQIFSVDIVLGKKFKR